MEDDAEKPLKPRRKLAAIRASRPEAPPIPVVSLPWPMHVLVWAVFLGGLAALGRGHFSKHNTRRGKHRHVFAFKEAVFSSMFPRGRLHALTRNAPSDFAAKVSSGDWFRITAHTATKVRLEVLSEKNNTIVIRRNNEDWEYLLASASRWSGAGQPRGVDLREGDVMDVRGQPFPFPSGKLAFLREFSKKLNAFPGIYSSFSVFYGSRTAKALALAVSLKQLRRRRRLPRLSAGMFPLGAKGGPLLPLKRPLLLVVINENASSAASFLFRGMLKELTREPAGIFRTLSRLSVFFVFGGREATTALRDLTRFANENMQLFSVIELCGEGRRAQFDGPTLRSQQHFDQLLLPQFFKKTAADRASPAPPWRFGALGNSIAAQATQWVDCPRIYRLSAGFSPREFPPSADIPRLEDMGAALMAAAGSAALFSRGIARRVLAESFRRLFRRLKSPTA